MSNAGNCRMPRNIVSSARHAGPRNAGQQEAHAQQDGLDEGHAYHAHCHGSDGGDREVQQPGPTLRIGQPHQDALEAAADRTPRRPS